MRRSGISMAMAVGLAAVVLSAVPVAAANYRPDARIGGDWGGPYTGNNVYNTTGAGQKHTSITFNPVVDQQHVFNVSIQNDGTRRDRYRVSAPGALVSKGWEITYYAPGCDHSGTPCIHDVTASVRAGTHRTRRVDAGDSTQLIIFVTLVGDTPPAPYKFSRLITVTSVGASQRKDAVKLVFREVVCGC